MTRATARRLPISLHFVVATDLLFADPALDTQAINAYVDTLASASNAVAIDPTSQPDFDDLRDNGVDKATKNNKFKIEDDIVAVTSDERTALADLAAADARFPTSSSMSRASFAPMVAALA